MHGPFNGLGQGSQGQNLWDFHLKKLFQHDLEVFLQMICFLL